MNFSILEQRSTQFPLFLQLIQSVGLTDPMQLAIVLQMQHEMWVSAEPAAYVRHVTGDGRAAAAEHAAEAAPDDRRVPRQAGLEPGRRDPGALARHPEPGGLDPGAARSTSPTWTPATRGLDVGARDLRHGLLRPLQPGPRAVPAAAREPDPEHEVRPARHAAALDPGLACSSSNAFLRPGGRVFNFCDGICDAAIPAEQADRELRPAALADGLSPGAPALSHASLRGACAAPRAAGRAPIGAASVRAADDTTALGRPLKTEDRSALRPRDRRTAAAE